MPIQTKPAVSRPGDSYEQEAERVADAIMRAPAPATRPAQAPIPQKRPPREDKRETIPTERAPPEPAAACPVLRAQATFVPGSADVDATSGVSVQVDGASRGLTGRGHALPEPVRLFMEPRFGHDFRAVRVHADAEAHALAHTLEARAFTVGPHIVFAAGQYAPASAHGRHLLAHELTHVVQQRVVQTGVVQRAPAPAATMPTLTATQTATFFTDLNAVLGKVLNVAVNLGPADYTVKRGAAFAAYIKQTTALSGDYTLAERQASGVCATTTPAAVAATCGTDKQCPRDLKRVQADPKLCRGAKATDELVSAFITTRGVTPSGGGPSVVAEETTQNAMLLNLVHEGVHRLRGAVWIQRSRIGGGYTHTRARPAVRLAHIGKDLDEGTVQIISDLAIAELQKVKGRSWFKGYTSSAYATEVAKVKKMLTDHGKNIDFLKGAYTAATSVSDVEDLQLWQ